MNTTNTRKLVWTVCVVFADGSVWENHFNSKTEERCLENCRALTTPKYAAAAAKMGRQAIVSATPKFRG